MKNIVYLEFDFHPPWQPTQMYRYERMPMANNPSMDAYNYQFDNVTEKVENLKRCVDKLLLHSTTLEETF